MHFSLSLFLFALFIDSKITIPRDCTKRTCYPCKPSSVATCTRLHSNHQHNDLLNRERTDPGYLICRSWSVLCDCRGLRCAGTDSGLVCFRILLLLRTCYISVCPCQQECYETDLAQRPAGLHEHLQCLGHSGDAEATLCSAACVQDCRSTQTRQQCGIPAAFRIIYIRRRRRIIYAVVQLPIQPQSTGVCFEARQHHLFHPVPPSLQGRAHVVASLVASACSNHLDLNTSSTCL